MSHHPVLSVRDSRTFAIAVRLLIRIGPPGRPRWLAEGAAA